MKQKKVNVQMLEPQPNNGIRKIDTTSSQTIAKPHVGRSLLKSLEIEATDIGFTVWVKERVLIGGKVRITKHWIIDASDLRNDGMVRMGEKNMYKIGARYNDSENCLEVGVS